MSMDAPALMILPYVWLTINGLLTAGMFALAVTKRIRRPFMLFGAATMATLAIWFALIAISAGPTPVVKRGDVADLLRVIAAVAGPTWSLWLLLYARSLIVIDRS